MTNAVSIRIFLQLSTSLSAARKTTLARHVLKVPDVARQPRYSGFQKRLHVLGLERKAPRNLRGGIKERRGDCRRG